MHPSSPQPLRIRDLMPPGYLSQLSQRTGCKQRSTINGVVLLESTGSKYWPAVEQLAEETNPEGFAAWKAAHGTLEVAAS